MKIIKVTSPKHGEFDILVDDEDYDYLNQFSWQIYKSKKVYYTARSIYTPKEKNKQKAIFMHRELLGVTDKSKSKIFVDHIDHNGLNNQRNNIRLCSNTENQKNKVPRGKSKYLGVWYNRNSIVSKIRINKVQVTIGQGYKTEEEAARAYDAMAKKHHGEFANLNFKD